jgi:hypothetical protein
MAQNVREARITQGASRINDAPELLQLAERVGVKIQPELSTGASDRRWIQPNVQYLDRG